MMYIMTPVNRVLSETGFTVPSGVFHGRGTSFTDLYVLTEHAHSYQFTAESNKDRKLTKN